MHSPVWRCEVACLLPHPSPPFHMSSINLDLNLFLNPEIEADCQCSDHMGIATYDCVCSLGV